MIVLRDLLLLQVVILGLLAVVKSDGVQTFPEYLTDDQIAGFEDYYPSPNDPTGPARNSKSTMIKKAITCRLKSAFGQACKSKVASYFGSPQAVVDITTLSRTTDRHADSYRPVHSPHQCHQLEEGMKVGFVVLQDNPNAVFRHGDEEVAIKKGTMVLFDGNVPHNTDISHGLVRLLGPVALTKTGDFAFVGTSCCEVNGTCTRPTSGQDVEECVERGGLITGGNVCDLNQCGACFFNDTTCFPETNSNCVAELGGTWFQGRSCLSEAPSSSPSVSPTDVETPKPRVKPSKKPTSKPAKKQVTKKKRKKRNKND